MIIVNMKVIGYSVHSTSTTGFLECLKLASAISCCVKSFTNSAKFATILKIDKLKFKFRKLKHPQFSFGASFIISEVPSAYKQRRINHSFYRINHLLYARAFVIDEFGLCPADWEVNTELYVVLTLFSTSLFRVASKSP